MAFIRSWGNTEYIPSLPCQRHFTWEERNAEVRAWGFSHHVKQKLRRHDDDEKVPPDVGPPSPTSSLKILVHSTQPLWSLFSLFLSWTFLGMPLPQHSCIGCPLWLECFLHPHIMPWLTISPPSSLSLEVPDFLRTYQSILFTTAMPCPSTQPLFLHALSTHRTVHIVTHHILYSFILTHSQPMSLEKFLKAVSQAIVLNKNLDNTNSRLPCCGFSIRSTKGWCSL